MSDTIQPELSEAKFMKCRKFNAAIETLIIGNFFKNARKIWLKSV
jgi:hypothetical protein